MPPSSPCRKRAWEETVVSAATGSIADSAVAAVVSSYGELSCVDEQPWSTSTGW